MLLAELEAYCSRPIAPTRRVSLGELLLPTEPSPGFGGVLLGGIVARFAKGLDPDFDEDLETLLDDVEHNRRIGQPRLRHRLQNDKVGLQRCRHRLIGAGEKVTFSFEADRGTPAQHVICAIYAAESLPLEVRPDVLAAIRKGMAWHGRLDDRLVAHLSNRSVSAVSRLGRDPYVWALGVLDLRTGDGPTPSRRVVQRAFREMLLGAHPDHGGAADDAAARIAELTEARRILIGS